MILLKHLTLLTLLFISTQSFGQNLVRAIELKNEAEVLHEKGQHSDALDKIQEAKKILKDEGRDIPESIIELENDIKTKVDSSPGRKVEKEEASSNQDDEVFTIVEEPASFPGGNSALNKYLGENLIYPEQAATANIQGRVFVGFIVDKIGGIRDVQILKGVHVLLDNEALRVIEEMPNWTPARHEGKTVKVKMTLPVTFRLN